MSNKDKAPLVPKLRFLEFQGDGEWRVCKAGDFLSESRNPSEQNDPARRITVRLNLHGVEHREHRGTESTEATNHFQRSAGQFIYGKQNIHKGAFGIIPAQLHNFETSQDLPCFDFKENCNPKWVLYHFAREDVYQPLELKMTGTGSKRLSEKNFLGLAIPAPSSSEQKKVAECLSSLDELIAAQARKVDALKTHKKGLMQQLFPREGETQPRLRFLEFRDAGEWEDQSIGNIGKVVTGSTPSTAQPAFYGGGIPFVSPADISDMRFVDQTKTTLTQEGYAQTRPIRAGSVLFVCIGSTIGKVAQNIHDCATNQQINAIIPNSKHSEGFVYFALSLASERIALLAGRQAVPIINKSLFSSVRILVPKLPEQHRIASFLSSIETLLTDENQSLELLKAHKKGLMQQIFPSLESI